MARTTEPLVAVVIVPKPVEASRSYKCEVDMHRVNIPKRVRRRRKVETILCVRVTVFQDTSSSFISVHEGTQYLDD